MTIFSPTLPSLPAIKHRGPMPAPDAARRWHGIPDDIELVERRITYTPDHRARRHLIDGTRDEPTVVARVLRRRRPPADAEEAERAGTTFLLLHGMTLNGCNTWMDAEAPVAARLASRGHVVVVPDLPGHGASSGNARKLRLGDHVVAVDACLSRLIADGTIPPRVYVVGHSLGGLILQCLLARRAPACGELGTGPWLAPWRGGRAALDRRWPSRAYVIGLAGVGSLGAAFLRAPRFDIPARVALTMMTRGADALFGTPELANHFLYDGMAPPDVLERLFGGLIADLPANPIRLLPLGLRLDEPIVAVAARSVIAGDRDRAVPLALGRALARDFGLDGPHVVEGAAHMCMIEPASWERVTDLLLDGAWRAMQVTNPPVAKAAAMPAVHVSDHGTFRS